MIGDPETDDILNGANEPDEREASSEWFPYDSKTVSKPALETITLTHVKCTYT